MKGSLDLPGSTRDVYVEVMGYGGSVRRFVMLVLMLFTLMVLALPAMAQEVDGSDSAGEAISVTATVVFISGAIAYLVEWARGRFPSLDGDILRVVSFLIALGAVFLWDLRVAADYGYAGLPDVLDAVASGVVIAFGAGVIGSWKNKTRSQDPTSSIHSE